MNYCDRCAINLAMAGTHTHTHTLLMFKHVLWFQVETPCCCVRLFVNCMLCSWPVGGQCWWVVKITVPYHRRFNTHTDTQIWPSTPGYPVCHLGLCACTDNLLEPTQHALPQAVNVQTRLAVQVGHSCVSYTQALIKP